ncbi:putative virulence related protein PagC [Serratia fonticola]|uniref:Putative virulence related protein PagC n=1 Tax=Serratia fonticola TaxID=47917 RepID=A0A542BS17_SERFO|nr:Ail/Lom family outer membrane beta-barrel protein [Serratia fonticola]TQI81354.1 putative virulence related protein PagC [Serratia fonticola]TQI96622.1 putative virulence related protein PagC [Serratia fonticola]TVZ71119.1 putative virulence related protein PagC [Serratia fonticola]
MKAVLMTSALVAALGLSSPAQADQQTVSLGYAQSKVQNLNNINGANLKYRYEWDSPVSVIGSFTYMSGNDNYSYLLTRDVIDNKVDIKYYSLSVGPAYRFNEFISVYGLLGLNYNKVDYRSSWNNYESGSYRDMGTETGNIRKTSLMYGVGVQINPIENVAVDIGYEGSSLDDGRQSHDINGFNIGIGYRF